MFKDTKKDNFSVIFFGLTVSYNVGGLYQTEHFTIPAKSF